MMPVNTSIVSTPKEGDYVVGFFFDGENAQSPIVMGILPGIPQQTPPADKGFSDQREDLGEYPKQGPKGISKRYPNRLKESTLNRMSRNEKLENTLIEKIKANKYAIEPATSYAAKYPFNNAFESESGHAIEFDDTPSAERVLLGHRTGTYTELKPDGTRVDKIVKDNYEVIVEDDHVYIGGNCFVTVKGNATVIVDGNVDATVGKNLTATIKGNATADIKGSAKVTVGSTLDISSGSTTNIKAGGTLNLQGSTVNIKGGTINLN
jgi:hypothetical protein